MACSYFLGLASLLGLVRIPCTCRGVDVLLGVEGPSIRATLAGEDIPLSSKTLFSFLGLLDSKI